MEELNKKYARQRNYLKTEKGKQKHREAQARYYAKSKDKQKDSNRKYLNSERGKVKKVEQNKRYREKIKFQNFRFDDPFDREYDNYKDFKMEDEELLKM